MKYLNALNKIDGVGTQKLKLLVKYFKNGENIWHGNLQEFLNAGISEKLATTIIREKEKINPDDEREKLSRENVEIISFTARIISNSLNLSA